MHETIHWSGAITNGKIKNYKEQVKNTHLYK